MTGKLIRRQRELHERYGDVIRLAPDEVSFANEQAWDDIYSFRRGHKRAPRDKVFFNGNPFVKLAVGHMFIIEKDLD